MKNYKVKGYDWIEIGKYFGVISADNNTYLKDTKKRILDLRNSITEKEGMRIEISETEKEQIQFIRKFVLELTENLKEFHYDWPLYEGLSKIESDDTFLQYVHILLENMWS